MDFKRFCALVKKYVHPRQNTEELNQLYIEFKDLLAHTMHIKGKPKITATLFIVEMFCDNFPDEHTVYLKRNKNKKTPKTLKK